MLDTTGSMGPLIEGAKRKIWSIATSIVDTNPDAEIRMGLVAYRDIGDEYVTKVFPLTTDIQDLYANLLELRARGGGDWPESVNEALHVGVTKLTWTQGDEVRRIMFLVGDAPPHMDYAQDIKYPEVMKHRARARHHRQRGAGRRRARHRAGVARDRADGPRPLHPDPAGRRPDRDHRDAVRHRDPGIAGPHQRHSHSVRPAPSALGRAQEDRAVRRSAAIGRLRDGRLYGKRSAGLASAEAVTGAGDLVADVTAGRQKLGAVKDDDLPDALRPMSPAQRQAEIDKQMTERKSLNARMSELVKKRDAHVVEQRKKEPKKPGNSFDRVVEETLKAQIRR